MHVVHDDDQAAFLTCGGEEGQQTHPGDLLVDRFRLSLTHGDLEGVAVPRWECCKVLAEQPRESLKGSEGHVRLGFESVQPDELDVG
ncbi:hypothetical protein GCM10009623_20430 [Nocardioides aestuarii]